MKKESFGARAEERLAAGVASAYRYLATNRVTRTPWAVIQTFSKANGVLLSGSMAYYIFLSLLPLLMIVGFVLGAISQDNIEFRQAIATGVGRIFRGIGGRDLLEQLIQARAAFGIVGLAAVFYAGSGFVGAMTACLNRMWETSAGRNPIGQKVINVLVALALGVALLASVGLTIWVAYLAPVVLGHDSMPVATWIESAASPLALLLVLVVLYRVLPARPLSSRSQLPGAVLATIGIEVLKRIFTLWSHYSAGLAALPRSVVSIVLLLVWLGFFAQVLLYGSALNVVCDRQRRGMSPFPPGELAR